MRRKGGSRWDPVSMSRQTEPVSAAADASADFIEATRPWITALSMLHREAIEKGLPSDVADDIVRGAMRMWEQEI